MADIDLIAEELRVVYDQLTDPYAVGLPLAVRLREWTFGRTITSGPSTEGNCKKVLRGDAWFCQPTRLRS